LATCKAADIYGKSHTTPLQAEHRTLGNGLIFITEYVHCLYKFTDEPVNNTMPQMRS